MSGMSRDGQDSPAQAPSRRTRSRGSPSIAPLSDGGSAGARQGSPSVGQAAPRMGTISEGSPSLGQQQQQQEERPSQDPSQQRQQPSNSLPPRSPSVGLFGNNARSPSAGVTGSQHRARTPGGARPHMRADLGPAPVRPNITVTVTTNDVEIPEIDTNMADGPGSATATTVIWGTSINAETLSRKVDSFLWNFKDESGKDKYHELVKKACSDRAAVVNLDTADLREADPALYKWLVAYPHEVLPMFDRQAQLMAANEPDKESDGDWQNVAAEVVFRPFKLDSRKTIRDLNPSDIDKLICVEGMVTRTSNVIPDLRVAHFCCAKCGYEQKVNNEGGKVEEPAVCSGCKHKAVFTLVHNLCTFSNKQLVKMQEKPNDIPEGETPHAVVLHAFEANVDICRPGDRVAITGILRALPMRVNPNQRTLHALFKTYIDILHIDRNETSRMFSAAADRERKKEEEAKAQRAAEQEAEAETQRQQSEQEQQQPGGTGAGSQGGAGAGSQAAAPSGQTGAFTSQGEPVADRMDMDGQANDTNAYQYVDLGNETEDQVKAKEDRIKALSQDPQIYKRLVASLAPNVWEMDDVKKGLVCQLFGGSGKTFPGGRIRGEINVLLVGDPSVSKSQLLSYVHALAPRGIYTSGKGSSAVGLTAYVTKDPETKEMVLESGALVLSDRGVCCIDEFDKMSDGARSMLHEAMEQQTVSVAKAGLISTLNARTSVCACANPIGSRYNPHLTLAENINLPPTLLTRFDLIYLVLDTCEEERDRRLARHLVSLFYEHVPVRQQQEDLQIPQDLLKEYIAYARTRIVPKLRDDAIEELVTAYCTLRAAGRDKKVVVATPRQLESLIRLSESLARMRLSEEVERTDVQEAVRLWYTAMQGSAASSDGTLDMDNIFTGASTEARQMQRQLPDDLRALLQGPAARAISVDDLFSELQRAYATAGKPSITKQQMMTALRQVETVTLDDRTGVVRPRAARA